MFDNFKKNLQKKLIEYQKQMENVHSKNGQGENATKNTKFEKKSNSNQQRRASFLSVMIWSMAFAMLINYFFFDNIVEKKNIDEADFKKPTPVVRNDVAFGGDGNFLQGNLNANGIAIDDISLVYHKKTIEPNSENVAALTPRFNKNKEENNLYSFMKIGYENSPNNKFYMPLPDESSQWKLIESQKNFYKFSWNNGQGLTFVRTISFGVNEYVFTVHDRFENTTGKTIEIVPYKTINQSIDIRAINKSSFAGAIMISDDVEEIKYNDIEDEKNIRFVSDKNAVIGFTDNYFAQAIITEKPANISVDWIGKNYEIDSKTGGKKEGKLDATIFRILVKDRNPIVVKPNSAVVYMTHVFTGAKNVDMLEKYAKEFNIPKMKMLVDYGTFFFIAQPAAALLRWLNLSFGNMGIAIILFGIIMKILLIPLSLKQMKMTYKMRQMAPELKRIQTYYSDNKFQMQMQMAMLYKKYKINPFASFLQLLI
ncbi:MAG: membrane protein insertase YidC, partial [Rickettsiales bacterium]|nr:membrane protein insertase YidC [Rickettsiales bacterium]